MSDVDEQLEELLDLNRRLEVLKIDEARKSMAHLDLSTKMLALQEKRNEILKEILRELARLRVTGFQG